MADDQLFLLEVLVDQIKFIKIPCFTDHDFKTCVSFQFLENAPLDICDSDGGGSTYSPDPAVKNMKNGKSCLFALKQSDIAKAKSNFLLNFSVYKTLPCSCLPQNVPIGKCTINMSKEFSEVAQQSAASPESPGSQSLKDSFPIKNDTGEETGQLNLFLRINCFGKVIVTGFQVADPEALPDRAIFQDAVSERAACNPKKDWKAIDDPCFCAKSGQSRQSDPCTADRCTKDVEEFFPPTPCQVGGACYCSGPPPNDPIQYPMTCRDTEAYCLHVPQGNTSTFEEMGTCFNGNDFTLRVPHDAAVIKRIGPEATAMQAPIASGALRNQIVFQMPGGGKEPRNETHFDYSAQGCGQMREHAPQCAPVPENVPGPAAAAKVIHPNKDVFVLKVAKKSTTGSRTSKLELELVTPKGPEKKIPMRMETRETQYTEDTCTKKKKKRKKNDKNQLCKF